MKLVLDKNIPFVRESFEPLGELILLEPENITNHSVREADGLVVRSVTNVNQELLDGSSVRFVGTVSAGYDHVSLDYLNENDVAFARAPGANANSVAEYVAAAILVMAHRKDWCLDEISIGIVGVGNVGSRVVEKAQALGLSVLKNDPPKKESTRSSDLLPLEKLMDCDIVTLHVPLSTEDPYPTDGLFNEERIFSMKAGSILVNTSRGDVVDETGLKRALTQEHLGGAVLDVWKNEPDIDTDLMERVDVVTPHVAGYALDGRVRGVKMIFEAIKDCFDYSVEFPLNLPEPENNTISVESVNDVNTTLNDVTKRAYDIEEDDREFREAVESKSNEVSSAFESFRHDYEVRREFDNFKVSLRRGGIQLYDQLDGLGFDTSVRK